MLIDAFLMVTLMALAWIVLRLQVRLQLARVALQAVEERLHTIERLRRGSEATSPELDPPGGTQVF